MVEILRNVPERSDIVTAQLHVDNKGKHQDWFDLSSNLGMVSSKRCLRLRIVLES